MNGSVAEGERLEADVEHMQRAGPARTSRSARSAGWPPAAGASRPGLVRRSTRIRLPANRTPVGSCSPPSPMRSGPSGSTSSDSGSSAIVARSGSPAAGSASRSRRSARRLRRPAAAVEHKQVAVGRVDGHGDQPDRVPGVDSVVTSVADTPRKGAGMANSRPVRFWTYSVSGAAPRAGRTASATMSLRSAVSGASGAGRGGVPDSS